jgi:hypothetical protein
LAWGEGNGYLGVSFNKDTDRIYLCALHDTGPTRCRASVANKPNWIGSFSAVQAGNHKYVYPVIIGRGTSFWMSAGAVPTIREDNSARVLASILRFDSSGSKLNKALSGTLGHINSETAFHTMDIGEDSKYIYVLGVYEDAPREVILSLIDKKSTTLKKQRLISPATGPGYNMIVNADGIYLFGKGKYHYSLDQGNTWESGDYVHDQFPKKDYVYTFAHTLKEHSGATLKDDTMFVLQQITNRNDSSDNRVLEFEFKVLADGSLEEDNVLQDTVLPMVEEEEIPDVTATTAAPEGIVEVTDVTADEETGDEEVEQVIEPEESSETSPSTSATTSASTPTTTSPPPKPACDWNVNKPVCGKKGPAYKNFFNQCRLKDAGYSYVGPGTCGQYW